MFDTLCDIEIENFLNPLENSKFKTDGYILVRNAIKDPNVLDEIERKIDEIDSQSRRDGEDHRGTTLDDHKNAMYFDFIQRHKLFVDLATWQTTFHKIWGLMGWNIFCYVTNLIVSPPDPKAQKFQHGKSLIKEIHQDGGRMNCEADESSMLSLKVGYFLSDCSGELDGNLAIIPSSHRERLFEYGNPQTARKETTDRIDCIDPELLADNAIEKLRPIKAKRGDAIIFDRRLWHTRTKNISDKTRKVLFYGYSYRWTRGYEYYCPNILRSRYPGKLNPILEQVLDIKNREGDNDYDTGRFVNNPLPLQNFVMFLENVGVIKDGVLV